MYFKVEQKLYYILIYLLKNIKKYIYNIKTLIYI